MLTSLALMFSTIGVTPAHAASFTVTNLNNSGAGSLRQAIIEANAAAGADTITFSVSGTILLDSTLPHITDADGLTMDGTGKTVIISGKHAVQVAEVDAGASLTLNNLTIADGEYTVGGGIVNNAGTLTITNSTFSGNSATNVGGGIVNNAGTLTITNSTFSGNSATNGGGGIFSSGAAGTVAITNSTFSGNSTSGQGGGIHISQGALAITNSTFTLNTASDAGGGIMNQGGIATITNSTFSGNSAPDVGGGGGVLSSGTAGALTITNSTFSGNSAIYGGGLRIAGGTAILRNTIVANSTSGENCSGPTGWITNGGNNIDDGTTCGWGSASGSMSGTDPLLGALAGSPAYFPLNASSPAIDAGNDAICEAAPVSNTSQNGLTRPQGLHCDIGSYEALRFLIYLPLLMR